MDPWHIAEWLAYSGISLTNRSNLLTYAQERYGL